MFALVVSLIPWQVRRSGPLLKWLVDRIRSFPNRYVDSVRRQVVRLIHLSIMTNIPSLFWYRVSVSIGRIKYILFQDRLEVGFYLNTSSH